MSAPNRLSSPSDAVFLRPSHISSGPSRSSTSVLSILQFGQFLQVLLDGLARIPSFRSKMEAASWIWASRLAGRAPAVGGPEGVESTEDSPQHLDQSYLDRAPESFGARPDGKESPGSSRSSIPISSAGATCSMASSTVRTSPSSSSPHRPQPSKFPISR